MCTILDGETIKVIWIEQFRNEFRLRDFSFYKLFPSALTDIKSQSETADLYNYTGKLSLAALMLIYALPICNNKTILSRSLFGKKVYTNVFVRDSYITSDVIRRIKTFPN